MRVRDSRTHVRVSCVMLMGKCVVRGQTEVVPSHALMCCYMCVCLYNRNTVIRCADKH